LNVVALWTAQSRLRNITQAQTVMEARHIILATIAMLQMVREVNTLHIHLSMPHYQEGTP
jgi:hypothetical protein